MNKIIGILWILLILTFPAGCASNIDNNEGIVNKPDTKNKSSNSPKIYKLSTKVNQEHTSIYSYKENQTDSVKEEKILNLAKKEEARAVAEKVFKNFYNSLKKGHISKAKKYITKNILIIDNKVFEAKNKEGFSFSGKDKILKERFYALDEDGRLTISYEFISNEDEVQNIWELQIYFINTENNTWKIDGFGLGG